MEILIRGRPRRRRGKVLWWLGKCSRCLPWILLEVFRVIPMKIIRALLRRNGALELNNFVKIVN